MCITRDWAEGIEVMFSAENGICSQIASFHESVFLSSSRCLTAGVGFEGIG